MSNGLSLTVSTDSLIISATIDGHEISDVMTLDIPGVFLNADNDEFVLMLMHGKLAEMMVKVDPTVYCMHLVTSAKGEPMLDVKLNKAFYGLLKAAFFSTSNWLAI